jgi:hypothetical protein
MRLSAACDVPCVSRARVFVSDTRDIVRHVLRALYDGRDYFDGGARK